jgi:hypothetical protein
MRATMRKRSTGNDHTRPRLDWLGRGLPGMASGHKGNVMTTTDDATRRIATELFPGDQIRAPQHERGWMGNRLCTVLSVAEGRPDKGGRWLRVTVNYQSPYAEKTSEMTFKIRPTSVVRIYYGIPA